MKCMLNGFKWPLVVSSFEKCISRWVDVNLHLCAICKRDYDYVWGVKLLPKLKSHISHFWC